MTNGQYGYCSAYVKATDPETVTELLAEALEARVENDNLYVPGVVMDARPNPDVADDSTPGGDFVRWPVLIEIDADDPNDGRTMVSVLSRVLTTLWDAGYPTVAACDFEDELPWAGGIRRVADAT